MSPFDSGSGEVAVGVTMPLAVFIVGILVAAFLCLIAGVIGYYAGREAGLRHAAEAQRRHWWEKTRDNMAAQGREKDVPS